MWVTKLMIIQVKKRIFCPKTTKFGPKLAFLVNLGQAMQAYSMPCCGSVGGCGARAVSRKTPIYFMEVIGGGGKEELCRDLFCFSAPSSQSGKNKIMGAVLPTGVRGSSYQSRICHQPDVCICGLCTFYKT